VNTWGILANWVCYQIENLDIPDSKHFLPGSYRQNKIHKNVKNVPHGAMYLSACCPELSRGEKCLDRLKKHKNKNITSLVPPQEIN
jgi:hypothetical protein